MRNLLWQTLIFFTAFTITTGDVAAMNIFKNDFEQRWEELSKDVNKLILG